MLFINHMPHREYKYLYVKSTKITKIIKFIKI